MRNQRVAGALFVAALLSCALASAQTNVYRWVDKDGKVHFSDTPPPADAKSSSQKRFGGGYVETENLPYATQMAARRNPVTLFTGSACGDLCDKGRDLLARRGVPFSERDVQGNASDAEALKKLVGALEVPTLLIGEAKLKGYEEGQWQAALDNAGYPRTRLPGQAAAPRKAPAPPPAPVPGAPPAETPPQPR